MFQSLENISAACSLLLLTGAQNINIIFSTTSFYSYSNNAYFQANRLEIKAKVDNNDKVYFTVFFFYIYICLESADILIPLQIKMSK